MTSSPSSAQPPSPFSPGSDAGALGGRAGVAAGWGGGTVIKPTLSPATSPVIDAAMLRALELARTAGAAGEVPVGAVLLDPGGGLVACAANAREAENDPTAHAETRVLRAAGAALGGLVVERSAGLRCTEGVTGHSRRLRALQLRVMPAPSPTREVPEERGA